MSARSPGFLSQKPRRPAGRVRTVSPKEVPPMDARPASHPSVESLKAFGLGKMDDASAEALMNHLDSCPDCCKEVAALSGDDFLARFRQAHGRSITPAPAASLSERALHPNSAPTTPASPTPIPNLPPELADNPE